MKLKQILNVLLIVIFLFSINGTVILVLNEYKDGNICPSLFKIPACYVILICFVIPFLAHISKLKNIFYFICTGLAFSIAFYGTTMQILDIISCPKTESGIPMCFISLGIFSTLILLKLYLLKKQ